MNKLNDLTEGPTLTEIKMSVTEEVIIEEVGGAENVSIHLISPSY